MGSGHDSPPPDAESLYEDAPCGLLVTGADGTIQRVNRTFCRWLGVEAHELIGHRKMQDLLTMGGRIFHQTHWAPLLQIQGSISEVKLEVCHRAGHTLPMVMNACRREHAGVVFHDIAAFVAKDRHQYERELLLARNRSQELLVKERAAQAALTLTQERLRLALESAHLFGWDIAPDTRQRRYEDKAALLLGHTAAQPLSEAEFLGCVHVDDRAAEAQAYAQALDPAHGLYAASFRLDGVDGRQRMVHATGRAFFDADGSLAQFAGVLHDMTEIVQQRAVAEDRAQLAEQMVGIVSHDLRNPLSAIQMSAALLARTGPSPNQLRVVDRITSATARANRLIGDLLDFTQARLGAGLTVVPKLTPLHELVGESVEELAVAFPGRRLVHRREGSGECVVDADRLAQVIGNLVGNAATYGAPEHPITITSTVDAEDCRISVHNEGPPVPPAALPTLFEPMTRGQGVEPLGLRSVGLGLFIVREIVRAHGGSATVVSTESEGTTFEVCLPRRQA